MLFHSAKNGVFSHLIPRQNGFSPPRASCPQGPRAALYGPWGHDALGGENPFCLGIRCENTPNPARRPQSACSPTHSRPHSTHQSLPSCIYLPGEAPFEIGSRLEMFAILSLLGHNHRNVQETGRHVCTDGRGRVQSVARRGAELEGTRHVTSRRHQPRKPCPRSFDNVCECGGRFRPSVRLRPRVRHGLRPKWPLCCPFVRVRLLGDVPRSLARKKGRAVLSSIGYIGLWAPIELR